MVLRQTSSTSSRSMGATTRLHTAVSVPKALREEAIPANLRRTIITPHSREATETATESCVEECYRIFLKARMA